MPKPPAEINNLKSKFGAFARLTRRSIDGSSLQWVLGALVALVVDAQARAEDIPSAGDGLDGSKIQYFVLDSEGANISAASDDASGDLGIHRKVLIQDPGIRPDLPPSLRQLLVDIASATPAESARLLEEIRANVIAQARTNKPVPLEKQSSVTVKGADGVNESKVTTISLDADGEVYKAIRQAALDYENGQLGKDFTITSAELNQAIPLQFVDENDQEILWAKEDFINPLWYLSPLGLLGLAGGGGGGGAAVASFTASGFVLEDAIQKATVVLEVLRDGDWIEAVGPQYRTVTGDDGSFTFDNISAEYSADLVNGTARIHVFALGTDSFSGASVGEFYLQVPQGQFSSSSKYTKVLIVDPITTISALTNVPESTLKLQLFGDSSISITPETLQADAYLQDAVRQIYATLRVLNEVQASGPDIAGSLTAESLTAAAINFKNALAASYDDLKAPVVQKISDQEALLDASFIKASVAQAGNDSYGTKLTGAEIERIGNATVFAAQNVTVTVENKDSLSDDQYVVEDERPLVLQASGYLSAYLRNYPQGFNTVTLASDLKQTFGEQISTLLEGQASFIKDVSFNSATDPHGRTAQLGTLVLVSNGNDQYYTYDVKNSDIRYLAEGETRIETFTITLWNSDDKGNKLDIAGSFTQNMYIQGVGVSNSPVFVDPQDPLDPTYPNETFTADPKGDYYTIEYNENSKVTDVLGQVKATDADEDTVTYEITQNVSVADPDHPGKFVDAYAIDSDGKITLTTAGVAAFTDDFEATDNKHLIKVTASDGQHTTTIDVKLNELNVNDNSPVFVDPQDPLDPTYPNETFTADPKGDYYTIEYNENSKVTDVLGQVKATDADEDTVTYEITQNVSVADPDHPGKFVDAYAIDSDGKITLTTAGVAAFTDDFEATDNKHLIKVTASDGQHTTTIDVKLNELNVNDNSPVFVDPQDPLDPTYPNETFTADPKGDYYTIEYNENSKVTDVLGQVKATDADNDTVTYEITQNVSVADPDDPGKFVDAYAIDSDGKITLTTAGVAAFTDDFEATDNKHLIKVTASDGQHTTTIDVKLNELNVNDNEKPHIFVADGDLDGASFIEFKQEHEDFDEEDSSRDGLFAPLPLQKQGTLTVNDPNRDDPADLTVDRTLGISGTFPGNQGIQNYTDIPWGIENFDPFAMLTLDPNLDIVDNVLDPSYNSGNINWIFDSATEQGLQLFDFLAEDETLILTYTIRATDSAGAYDTHDITITITGTNDEPLITVVEGDGVDVNSDSIAADLTESDEGLSASGTLSVTDLDLSDTVSFETTEVAIDTTNEDVLEWLPSEEELIAMMTTDPVAGLDATPGDAHNLTWNFNSNTQAFNYLAVGETLTLTYTITATDSSLDADSTSQEVTILITGTNDYPVISLLEGDTATAALTEENEGLITDGTITIADIDLSDDVALGVDVQVTSAPESIPTILPSAQALVAMLQIGPITAATPDEPNNVQWTFDSQDQAFDYLADGETLELTYTITADDGNGGTATQNIVITITGTDDAPIIASDTGTTGEFAEFADTTNLDLPNGTSGTLSFFDDVSDLRDITITDTTLEEDSSESEVAIVSKMANGTGPQVVAYYSLADGNGPVELEEESTQYQDILSVIAASQFTADDDYLTLQSQEKIGQINWHFTVPADASLDFLAVGEQLQLVYTVQLSSAALDGVPAQTTTQEVTITIIGTNDVPVFKGGSDSIAITEEVTPLGHFTQTGALRFADADLTDHHTVTVINPENVFGELTAYINTDTTNGYAVGEIVWSYRAAYDQMEYLAEGKKLEQKFTIQLDDGNGGIVEKEISLTITGTNDEPLIDTTVLQETNQSLTASGVIPSGDDYLHGILSISKLPVLVGVGSAPPPEELALALDGMLTIPSTGKVNPNATVPEPLWKFDSLSENFDYLAIGEKLDLVYGINLYKNVAINTKTDQFGDVTYKLPPTIYFDGTVDFADIDITDSHNVRFEWVDSSLGGLLEPQSEITIESSEDGHVAWHYLLNTAQLTDAQKAELINLAPESFIELKFKVIVDDQHNGIAEHSVTLNISRSGTDLLPALKLSVLRDITITITGTNDTPVITVVEGDGVNDFLVDSIAADLTESDEGLSASGTLSVTDLDLSDTVSFETTEVAIDTTNEDVLKWLPSEAHLIAMLSTDATLDANLGDVHNLTWNFNSNTQAFNYLAVGETLTLTYTITATDSSLDADSTSQEVTIIITGTNDYPVISTAGEEDAFTATIEEENAGLQTAGTITIEDLDLSDNVAISIASSVGVVAPAGTELVLPTQEALLAMFVIDTATDATPGEYSEVEWSFNSQGEAFDYLADGETLDLTYTITADDGHGGIVTQDITITIAGTNDTPVITVVEGDGVDVNSDSIAADLTESDEGLSASGTLSVTDLDLSDTVSFETTEVAIDTTNEDVLEWLPSEEELIAMMTTDPVAGLDATPGDVHNLTWNFNSNTQAFNYLAVGETLTLTYTITATDSSLDADSTSQEVTILITGTNDVPVISTAGEEDAFTATIEEENAGLQTAGTITIEDLDLSDNVAISIASSVGVVAPAGTELVLPTQEALLAMFVIDTATDATPGEYSEVEWSFNSQGEAFDYLADGETLDLTYTITADDGHGGIVTQDITITIAGTNDTPVITVVEGDGVDVNSDSIAADLTESDEGLSASGTLSVTDLDLSDTVSFETTEVAIDTTNEDVLEWLPSEEELIAMMTTDPVAGLDATPGDVHNLTWNFNSNTQAFNYLAVGETLTLTYTITATDSSLDADSTSQEVTILITGTNDYPVISLLEGDTATAALTEENEGLITDGTITIADIDLSDDVALGVDVQVTSAPESIPTILPSAQALVAMLQIGPITAATPDEPNNVQWTFDSQDQAFDYLADGETLELTYTITADDGNGGTATQNIVITITGTDDAPIIASDTGTTGEFAEFADTTNLDLPNGTSGTLSFFDDVSDLRDITITDTTLEEDSSESEVAIVSKMANGTGPQVVAYYSLADGNGPVELEEESTQYQDILSVIAASQFTADDDYLTLQSQEKIGQINWHFTVPADASLDFLAVGEQLQLVYTVQLSSAALDGVPAQTTTQEVTITIIGTNDVPVISVLEGDLDNAQLTEVPQSNESVPHDLSIDHLPSLVASGTISVNDVDLTDEVSLSATSVEVNTTNPDILAVLPREADLIAMMSVEPATEVDANPGDHNNVQWTFDSQDQAFDYLADGETLELTYTITADDGNGGTATQNIVITITGTDDAPIIASDTGTTGEFAEFADTTNLDLPNGTSGTLSFFDDVSDLRDITITDTTLEEDSSESEVAIVSKMANGTGPQVVAYYSLADGNGPVELEEESTQYQDILSVIAASQFTADDDYLTLQSQEKIGQINWHFTVPADASLDFLAVGEQLQLVYTVQLSSAALDGVPAQTTTQEVTITIIGTNDVPVFKGGSDSIAITEEVTPLGHFTQTGALRFADADLTDHHTVTVINPENVFGELTAYINTDTTNGYAVGEIVWSYRAAYDQMEYLAEGKKLEQKFTIQLDDGNGGIVEKEISLTITGTNDEPLIDTTVLQETNQSLTASGLLLPTQPAFLTDYGSFDGTSLSTSFSITASGVISELLAGKGLIPGHPNSPYYLSLFSEVTRYDPQTGYEFETWQFDSQRENFDYLALGESVNFDLTFETSAAYAVTDPDENTTSINGVLAFSDADFSDEHLLGLPEILSNSNIGTLHLELIDTENGLGGQISWSYTIDWDNLSDQDLFSTGAYTHDEIFVVQLDDGNGGTVEKTIVVTITSDDAGPILSTSREFFITVTGTNDAPVINVITDEIAVDTNASTISETDEGLVATGTLTVIDLDLSDSVSLATTLAVDAPQSISSALPSPEALLAMFTTNATLDANLGDAHNLTWNFNSNTQAFNYLAVGETLTLTYTITATDSSLDADSTSQEVTILITGTNDYPVISTAGEQDAFTATIEEENAGLQTAGTITIEDLDLSDVVALTVDPTVQISAPEGVLLVLPSNDVLFAMFAIDPATAATPGEYSEVEWSFDSQEQAFDYLAQGETLTLTYTVTADDGHNGIVTQDIVITITGTNDTPVIEVVESLDSIAADFIESDLGLVASGTLSVTDLDLSDTISFETTQVAIETTNEAVLDFLPSEAELIAMMTTDPVAGLDATPGDVQNLTWNFNSNTQAFNYLAEDETLTLTYTITATDSSLDAATTSQEVTITITGTNDVPVISLEEGDVAVAELAEENAGLAAEGSITIIDLDVSDDVALGVQVQAAGPDGVLAVLPSSEELVAMLQIDPIIAATPNELNNVAWSFDSQEQAFDYLAQGETLTLTYTVTADDGHNGIVTQDIVITITGTNDTPVIEVVESLDSIAADFIESNDGLVASGTLSVTDLDLSDTISFETTQVAIETTNEAVLDFLPSEAELIAMMTTDPVAGLDATPGDAQNLTWNFNSDIQAFNYLAEDETLTLTYTITATDSSSDAATTSQEVTITITGTNDVPVISLEEGDVAVAELAEENAGLTAEGSITIIDLDVSDDVALGVQVQAAGPDGVLAVLPSPEELVAMLQIDPIIAATPNELNNVAWSFDSQEQAFDYLAQGETLTLTYTVTADDGHNGIVTQDIVITITGTNDTPVIEVVESLDSIAADFIESDLGLVASGTLSVTDLDLSDTISFETTQVAIETTNEAVLDFLPSEAELIAMMTTDPVAGLDATPGDVQNLTWNFNSNTQAFNYLAEDETLTLTYTITATDSSLDAATTSQEVTITITGTNDVPELSFDVVNLLETDSASDLNASGTLTIADLDHDQSIFIAQEDEEGEYGTFSVDENGNWTYVSSSAHNEFLAGQTYTDTFDVYSFDGTKTTVTINIDGTSSTITDAYARTLIEAGDLALNTDYLTVEASTPTLLSSLKDLKALAVDVVALSGQATESPVINVNLGEGEDFDGGLTAGLFDPSLTVNVDLTEEQIATDLEDFSSNDAIANLQEAGIDQVTINVNDNADLDALLLSNPDTLDQLETLDYSGLATTIDAGGRDVIASATASDALAHHLAQDGIDFAQADHLTVDVDGSSVGTHMQTSLKELQKLGVDSVLLQGATLDDQVDVTLGEGAAFTGGLSEGMFDADPAISFNLELDQDQLGDELSALVSDSAITQNLVASGLDTVSVNLEDDVNLDEILGNGNFENLQSLDQNLNVTLDVGGRTEEGSATASDALAHHLAEGNIDFAQADELTVIAEGDSIGTHMQTSLKELQKLGVDSVLLQGTILDNQVDVALGSGDAFTGGLSEGMFDADPAISFNLELNQDQLGDELSALVDDSAITQNLVDSGLDTSSVNLQDNVNLDEILGNGNFENLQSLDDSLNVTLDVGGRTQEGSATASDALAHHLAEEGIDFAQADHLTVDVDGSSVGTHMQTSLKELQKLGVDSVLLQGTTLDNQVDVALGEGDAFTGGLTEGMFDADPAISFNLELNQDQLGEDLSALVDDSAITQNLVASGLDTVSVNLQDNVNLDEILDNSTFEHLQTLDDSLNVTLDVGGRTQEGSATASDALTHHLAEEGIDFAHADHLAVIAEGDSVGTHMQTSLKELQKLGVDSVLLQGTTLDNQVDVTLGEGAAFTGGLTEGMFDADPAISFNLELDQDQLGDELSALVSDSAITQNLVASGLDTVSVNLEDDVNLDEILGNGNFENLQSLDHSLNVTLDVGGRTEEGSATASDALTHHLAEGNIDFAQADELTVIAEGDSIGTHMQTSLKELQKLGVDSALLSGGSADGQVDVALGSGDAFTGGLSEGMFDADPAISFNLELNQDQLGDELSALVDDSAITQNLVDSGLDTSSVNLQDNVNLDEILANGNFENLQSLDDSLNVTLDVGGRTEEGSATASDALAHHLAEEGIDFAQADHLTVDVDGSSVGTHLQTSLKELQKLGVDHIAIMGGEGGQVDVALGEGDAFTGGLTEGMFDADPAISFNLELDQDQLDDELSALVDDSAITQNLVGAGLDTASVDLEDDVNLDEILGNGNFENLQSLDHSLNVTLDVGGRTEEGSATASDALTHHLAEGNIDFAQADELTVIAEGDSIGTHLQTSLKELQKLGVDSVLLSGGTLDGQVDVTLGEGAAFTGGLTEGMFDADPAISFNLELNQDQLGDELSALVDDSAITQNLVASGLDTSSVNLQDNVNLDEILGNGNFENLQSLDQNLNVTLDVGGRTEEGSATASDALAHHLAVDGIDFAQADHLAVVANATDLNAAGDAAVGTHLQTSLKELQKLGVDAVLLEGVALTETGVKWTVDLGDGTWNPEGALPLFGDMNQDGVLSQEENDAFDITLNIKSWDDLGSGGVLDPALIEALLASGIDTIDPPVSLDSLIGQSGEWMGLSQINTLHNAGLNYVQALIGSMNPLEPSSLDQALSQEVQSLENLGKLTHEQALSVSQALHGFDVLGQFTTPDKFGDLVSALTNSGVADFVVDGGSVEISDPLAAALVDAGMLQALPQANLIIDATNSGDHLFTSLKALADLGIDHINTLENRVYIDLGLPSSDANAIADIKAILASLDPANQAKSIFGQDQHGVLVIDNGTADAINKAGGLDEAMIQALNNLGINEIDILADSKVAAQTDIVQAVAQTPLPPVEVKVIGMAEDPILHDHLQPHVPTPR